MCLQATIGVIKQIDKFRRHCLLRGSDINANKPPLAPWCMVQRPKMLSGLGVINVWVQNDALLMKHLNSFHNKNNSPRLSRFGENITRIEWLQWKRETIPSSGRNYKISISHSKGLLKSALVMVSLSSYGKIFGTQRSWVINLYNCSPLLGTKIFH